MILKYLHSVGYSMSGVFNDIEITASLLLLTQCRYKYTKSAMVFKLTKDCSTSSGLKGWLP